MKVRYILLSLTVLIIAWIAFGHCRRINNQVTNIDYLEALAKEVKLKTTHSRNIYFLSGSNSVELYYKTQLALAPHVVSKVAYNEIPKDSLILFVTDLHTQAENLENEKEGTTSASLYSVGNEMYQFKLIRK